MGLVQERIDARWETWLVSGDDSKQHGGLRSGVGSVEASADNVRRTPYSWPLIQSGRKAASCRLPKQRK